MRIRVTKSDIENGKRRNGQSCPIALASRRAFFNKYGREPYKVIVDRSSIYIDGRQCPITQQMFDFIVAFDAGKKDLAPCSFSANL